MARIVGICLFVVTFIGVIGYGWWKWWQEKKTVYFEMDDNDKHNEDLML